MACLYLYDLTTSQSLEELGNVSSQRLQQLRRFDKDCADVVEWLRKPETRARFQHEIAEPAFLSLDIPDPRYRDQIDSLITKIQVKVSNAPCIYIGKANKGSYHLDIRLRLH